MFSKYALVFATLVCYCNAMKAPDKADYPPGVSHFCILILSCFRNYIIISFIFYTKFCPSETGTATATTGECMCKFSIEKRIGFILCLSTILLIHLLRL